MSIQDFLVMESGNNIVSPTEDFSRHTHEPYAKLCPESLHIPYEFRCPISLVIMKDPVIICTGQFQVCMTPTPGGLVNSMTLIHFTAGELRLLTKKNGQNRMLIAEAGAIPCLVDLLYALDTQTSVSSHLFQPLWGGWEQNCNWCIWSNPSISCSILGGKVDAAKALLNLCLSQGNKGQAITASIVPKLIEMLTEPDGDMRDEAFAVMAVVAAGHSDGQATIGSMNVVSTLVELVSNGPPRNKENATSVLVIL
ncbi:U-box domain-containing protein 13 [Glycine max]|nr:U-box domain-containing protein 13 [Glycine max]